MTEARILVVDDNRNVITALEMLLTREFSGVSCISNPSSILKELGNKAYSAVLLDMNYKAGRNTGSEGLFWLGELTRYDPDLSVVLITAFGDIELAVTALKEGAVDFVLKPWDNQKLLATMRTAVNLTESRRKVKMLQKEKESLRDELRGPRLQVIGRSPAMKKVMKLVQKVSDTNANVLITGENGTGKDLIAREIHWLSGRSREIMVTVDLGAVPDALFEDELFGHVKGAFTDAWSDRCGKIEASHRGTLFFDEIGNLSLPMQAKLLHVLQNRTVTRLGGSNPVPVDLRLICATNRDLNSMVEEGSFRMDLLYRINTIQVEVPPLRERDNDILLLAEYFLGRFSSQYRKPGLELDASAKGSMRQWNWPGNVRELQHIIERAVILAEDRKLTAASFRFHPPADLTTASLDGSLEEVEQRLITHSIRKNSGNMSAVASQLGITRQTLYNKIRKYGL